MLRELRNRTEKLCVGVRPAFREEQMKRGQRTKLDVFEFHELGDVEAWQGDLNRLSNLEEGFMRAYGEEDPIELRPRRLCGDLSCLVCAVHLSVPLL